MSCDLGTSMRTGLTGNGHGGPSAHDSLIYQARPVVLSCPLCVWVLVRGCTRQRLLLPACLPACGFLLLSPCFLTLYQRNRTT